MDIVGKKIGKKEVDPLPHPPRFIRHGRYAWTDKFKWKLIGGRTNDMYTNILSDKTKVNTKVKFARIRKKYNKQRRKQCTINSKRQVFHVGVSKQFHTRVKVSNKKERTILKLCKKFRMSSFDTMFAWTNGIMQELNPLFTSCYGTNPQILTDKESHL